MNLWSVPQNTMLHLQNTFARLRHLNIIFFITSNEITRLNGLWTAQLLLSLSSNSIILLSLSPSISNCAPSLSRSVPGFFCHFGNALCKVKSKWQVAEWRQFRSWKKKTRKRKIHQQDFDLKLQNAKVMAWAEMLLLGNTKYVSEYTFTVDIFIEMRPYETAMHAL